MTRREAILALENGTWFKGMAAGAEGEAGGEVVFNTSMTGYQEILTDPSYAGQIVTMTAPEIGNYGVADEDVESRGIQVAGFVVMPGDVVRRDARRRHARKEGACVVAVVDRVDMDVVDIQQQVAIGFIQYRGDEIHLGHRLVRRGVQAGAGALFGLIARRTSRIN